MAYLIEFDYHATPSISPNSIPQDSQITLCWDGALFSLINGDRIPSPQWGREGGDRIPSPQGGREGGDRIPSSQGGREGGDRIPSSQGAGRGEIEFRGAGRGGEIGFPHPRGQGGGR